MTRFLVYLCLIFVLVAALPQKRKKVSSTDGKIVGGKETDISTVPYQVSLQYQNRHICGGSVISAKHILTAAHCVQKGRPTDYSIRAGSNYHTFGGETRRVVKITTHPSYNPSTTNNDAAVVELEEPLTSSSNAKNKLCQLQECDNLSGLHSDEETFSLIMRRKNKIRSKDFNNDVAVLELARPLQMGRTIHIIRLSENEPRTGDEVLVSGWGATKEGGSAARTIQSVTVPTISRQTCQRVYMRYNTITNNMFCAGYLNGGKDACQGDSGGPAIVNGRQAGIVSWGAGCARKGAPGVYTNIANLLPWIQLQTQETKG